MKKLVVFFAILFVSTVSISQPNKLVFVHLTDTHVGSSTGADDLRRTVSDINHIDSIQFILLSGDITEFGADTEIKLAKQILDSLNKPWFIIPGNHDCNWSESGGNTFKQVFGSETFAFEKQNYFFLGTNCGPNMRMGPGQIPHENIVWLDSIVKTIPDQMPIIFINHYPQDSSLNNWFEAIDRLKQKNIQLILCGHGHRNHKLNFEGIPAVMGRSNLRANKETGGFNIVTIQNDTVTYSERNPGIQTKSPWLTLVLKKLDFQKDTTIYPRPSYEVNKTYNAVKELWTYQDNSDIGSGTASNGKLIFTSNTNGEIVALNKKSGKPEWKFKTHGKIYSTPAVAKGIVVAGSSDSYIYAIHAKSGRQCWKIKTEKAVLGNPVIDDNTVFIGSSDGHFRAIDLKTGQLRWDFKEVSGFVVARPLVYADKIYFGCWNNDFYCLNKFTGALLWKWNNKSGNRMYSPAACFPVATHNRVFIVAPDRYMTAFDATSGNVIWRKQIPSLRVRESMGLATDSAIVFVKTMEGNVYGISTTANDMEPAWKSAASLGYEICPTAIVQKDNLVFVPTQSGKITALDRETGKIVWEHKTSNALVTNILPLKKKQVLVTTMDGKITMLGF